MITSINRQNFSANNVGLNKSQIQPAFGAKLIITRASRKQLSIPLRKYNYKPNAVFARLKTMVEEATKNIKGTIKIDLSKEKYNRMFSVLMFKDQNGKEYTKYTKQLQTKNNGNSLLVECIPKVLIDKIVSFKNHRGNVQSMDITPIMEELSHLYAEEHGNQNNPFHIIHYRMVYSDKPLEVLKNKCSDKSPLLIKFWRKYRSSLRLVANNTAPQ